MHDFGNTHWENEEVVLQFNEFTKCDRLITPTVKPANWQLVKEIFSNCVIVSVAHQTLFHIQFKF